MLEKIKLKNSSIILIGLVIILIGISIGLYEFFLEKKQKAYTEMNVLLYESETPENIKENEELPIEPQEIIEENVEQNEEPTQVYKNNYLGILEIPKIGLRGGFYDLNSRLNNVDYNITLINGSTFPDVQNNNLILAAHSGICPVCYFNDLYKLVIGDQASVTYKDVKYTYKIVNIYEVDKDGTVPIHRNGNKNTLTLITCTRNSNTKQTVYILELI